MALDMMKVQPLIDRLAAQLADADAEASDTAEELQTLTQGTSLAKGLQKVVASISDYDFDTALDHLGKIKQ